MSQELRSEPEIKPAAQFGLRSKILFFSVMLALIPLGISSTSMITITQDELKSSVQSELTYVVQQISQEIDNTYNNTWSALLMLIRNSIDNIELGVEEKISLLKSGVQDIPDFVSLQLTVKGFPPASFYKESFQKRLSDADLDINQALSFNPDYWDMPETNIFLGELRYIEKVKMWLIDLNILLATKISDQPAILTAYVNLDDLIGKISEHPFNKVGILNVIDGRGRTIFPGKKELNATDIGGQAVKALHSNLRLIQIETFDIPPDEKMLGGFAIPESIDWIVIVGIKEKDAYMVIEKMLQNLVFWLFVGLLTATLGASFFSRRITRPILKIGEVVKQVGYGNLNVRVSKYMPRDEIGELAQRINDMIQGLLERFHLQKFVSGQTVLAIQGAGFEGVKLGGERKYATVLFSDIRNFTAFSESVEPETVIEMLNTYLSAQAKIVRKYHGDIDKYVGDELVAVFHGPDMVENAMMCACDIHSEIDFLNESHPNWNIHVGIGINTGEMVMGAMGSEDRMDYTIIGDNVNLGARLCSFAKATQTIISQSSYAEIKNKNEFDLRRLSPIHVKGKKELIHIYEVAPCRLSVET